MPPKDSRRGGGPAQGAEGNQRNEYIPSFISKKPFYVDDDGKDKQSDDDYLQHQRLQTSTPTSQSWYERGRKGPAATKFRKGACENCGAMGHSKKDCLSRPRKRGAKYTGKDIQADDVTQDLKLGWDAKRDRWNGYDASEYTKVIEEYNTMEEMKKELKRIQPGDGAEGEDGDGQDGQDEGDRYEEETDMGRQQSTSTRNLRLREDTAKYLLNLDLDSAKYDPKTRRMVDSGAGSDHTAALVAEEGFMKASGDAGEFEKAQTYAWETQERGDKNKLHLQANPTAGEYYRRKEKEESATKKEAQRKALLEVYGGQENFKRDPAKDAAVVENNRFVEYDEKGKIKGEVAKKRKSMYAEDVYINNHTSVWGSWWRDFQWGYACCHSTVKNSYCTGEEGKQALQQADRLANNEEVPKEIAWQDEANKEEHVPNAVEDDAKAKNDADARKRKLDYMRDGGDDEGMEEYRKRKMVADDPMAKHLGRDELLS